MATASRPSALRSSWTELEGLGIHARTALRRDAPTLVLVHGLVVSSRYMVPVADELAAFASVHAPDLPGFGRSTKPRRTLATAELARTLAAWMEATGLEQATFVANSFGCQVAVELAARAPARTNGIVLVGPTMDPGAGTARQVARWIRSGLHERPSLPLVLARDLLDAGVPRSWRTFRDALRDPMEEKLRQVDAPALVVRGQHDPIVPGEWAERVAELLPRGRLVVVPGGGHALNYSRPHALAAIVRAFVAELGEPRPATGATARPGLRPESRAAPR